MVTEMLRTLFSVCDGQLKLDPNTLRYLQQQIVHRKVAIVAVAGKFRQGKTFFENILLKSLRQLSNGIHEWEYHPQEIIGGPDQIHFQNGTIGHTKGIMVWPEVFLRREQNGQETAILLLDTQGTFDTGRDTSESVLVFSAATLLASHLVFNTKSQLDSSDLDALNVFLEFSRHENGQIGEKIGQNLTILIRDANESHGYEEGRFYLNNLRKDAQRSQQMTQLIDGIFDGFANVFCSRVPTPDSRLQGAKKQIEAAHCGQFFLETLKCCGQTVARDTTVKRVLAGELDGEAFGDYCRQIERYLNLHSIDHGLGSAHQSMVALSHEKAKSEAEKLFQESLRNEEAQLLHQPMDPIKHEEKMKQILKTAIECLESRLRFGKTEEKEKIKAEIVGRFQETVGRVIDTNKKLLIKKLASKTFELAVKTYETEIRNRRFLSDANSNPRQIHEECQRIAVEFYTTETVAHAAEELIKNKRQQLVAKCEEALGNILVDHVERHLNNRVLKIVAEVVKHHEKNLKEAFTRVRSREEAQRLLPQLQLQAIHEKRDVLINQEVEILNRECEGKFEPGMLRTRLLNLFEQDVQTPLQKTAEIELMALENRLTTAKITAELERTLRMHEEAVEKHRVEQKRMAELKEIAENKGNSENDRQMMQAYIQMVSEQQAHQREDAARQDANQVAIRKMEHEIQRKEAERQMLMDEQRHRKEMENTQAQRQYEFQREQLEDQRQRTAFEYQQRMHDAALQRAAALREQEDDVDFGAVLGQVATIAIPLAIQYFTKLPLP